MADYDSNIIKPVDNLQNVTGLAPTRRREERSRRQQLKQDNQEKEKQKPNKPVVEPVPEDIPENKNNPDDTRIDYRA